MSRPIDADKLIKKMERRYEEMRLKYGEYDQFNMGYAEGMVAIDNAPTVDAVEVVRCKDCKYHCDLDGGVKCQRMDGLLMTFPDDYCSYGRRAEDEI